MDIVGNIVEDRVVRRILSRFVRSLSFIVSVLFHCAVSKSFNMVLIYGMQVLVAWGTQNHVVVCWPILISKLVVSRFQVGLAIWCVLIVLRLLIAVGCILIVLRLLVAVGYILVVLRLLIALWLSMVFPFIIVGCHIQ